MPTLVTKTVKSAGGDYTSLSAWEAGQQANIVTADQIQEAECYAFQDTTTCSIAGWTTDATRFIRVRVATGNRHGGVRATGYRLVSDGTFGPSLTLSQNHVRLEGVALKNTSTSGSGGDGIFVNVSGSGDDIRLSDCLVYDCRANSGADGYSINIANPIRMQNCIALNCTGDGFNFQAGGTVTAHVFNCVSLNNGGAGFHVAAFRTLNVKNCYSGGNTGADYLADASGVLNKTTCHAEDGTGNTTTAFSTSSGAYFTSVTAGSEDVHIGTLSALKDSGTDLSADGNWTHPDGSVDFEGNARSTWDVGADEFVTSGVTVSVSAATGLGSAPGVVTATTVSGAAAVATGTALPPVPVIVVPVTATVATGTAPSPSVVTGSGATAAPSAAVALGSAPAPTITVTRALTAALAAGSAPTPAAALLAAVTAAIARASASAVGVGGDIAHPASLAIADTTGHAVSVVDANAGAAVSIVDLVP